MLPAPRRRPRRAAPRRPPPATLPDAGARRSRDEAAVCVVVAAARATRARPATGDRHRGPRRSRYGRGRDGLPRRDAPRRRRRARVAGGGCSPSPRSAPTLAEAARPRLRGGRARSRFDGMQYRRDIAASAAWRPADGGRPAVIRRYSLPEMARALHRRGALRLLARGRAPRRRGLGRARRRPGRARRRRPRRARRWSTPPSSQRSTSASAVTDHDVAAFVDVVQDGDRRRRRARGSTTGSPRPTSSTPRSRVTLVARRRPADRGGRRARRPRRSAGRSSTPATPMLGRTHGMHAEPTTFGAKLALYLPAGRPGPRRGCAGPARRSPSASSPARSGPTRTSTRRSSARVCAALGLRPVPATQVLARDRHAEYLYACASVGTTIEAIATELRHLQRSEVGEAEEPFGAGQKGSSAMPHKRNPITAERLVGMARVLRGYLVAGLEDVALWHERDISHSSVERIVLPDASLLAYYALRRMTRLDRRSRRPRRTACARTCSRARSASSSPSRSCSRSSPPGSPATTPTASSSATPAPRFEERRAVPRRARARTTSSRQRSAAASVGPVLDEAFDLDRALRHAHRTIDALEEVEAMTLDAALLRARSATSTTPATTGC